ncbi:MAG TPA: hypothetical protein VNC13_06165 [Propionibacteriaceae bacterium]|nr:hypothetical protein [Propionibacteriaceae bacterium]
MTAATISAPQALGADIVDVQPSWRTRRRQSRQLRLRDQISARLAELDQIACILNDAAELVRAGWLQDSWFAYRDDAGRIRPVNAYNAKQLTGHPVVAACLVGAIVQAGGGLPHVRTQVVQRALDVTWHTLAKTPPALVRRTPAPETRLHHVQDLTRWNDHPGRTAGQAEELLRRSATAARSEADIVRRVPVAQL